MTVIGEAFVEIKPKTDGFAAETEKGVTGGLSSVAKKAAVAFGGVLAVGAAAHFVEGFVKAGAASDKIARITGAVIQSTGNAAGVSAGQVGDLANKLSSLSGIDDETIQASENIVLSFKNIKNAAGAGNDIFNQTSQAALDMATVMGTDVSGASLQLAKALNDPAQGLAKLTRAGVTFTDQQKEQIKALQASGDILGAQKIILGEVESEFGGAAAAAADPFQRLSVTIDNLKEAIGSALIPILTPATNALTKFIQANQSKIVSTMTRAIDALGTGVRFLEPGFVNIGKVIGAFIDLIRPAIEFITGFSQKLRDSIFGIDLTTERINILSTTIAGLITTLAGLKVASSIASVLQPLGSVLTGLAGAAGIAATPLVLIAGAFLAVAGAGELLYQKVKPVHDLLDELFGSLAPIVAPLIALGSPILIAAGAFKFLYDRVAPLRAAIGFLGDTFSSLIDTLKGIDFGAIFAGLTDKLPSIDFSGIASGLGGIVDTVSGVGDKIGQALGSAVDAIRSAVAPAVNFLIAVWAKYGDEVTGILVGFRDIAVAVFQRVVDVARVFGEALSAVLGVVQSVAGGIRDAMGPAFEFIAAVVQIALAPIAGLVEGAFGAILATIETFATALQQIWTVAWDVVSSVVENVVGPISNAIEGLLTIIQGVVDIVAGIFTGDWTRIWQGFQEIVGGSIEFITGELGVFIGILEGIFSNLGEIIVLPFQLAWDAVTGIINAASALIAGLIQSIVDTAAAIWANITTVLTAPVEVASALISGLIDGIVGFFAGLPGRAVDALASFAGNITNLATTALSSMGTAISTGVTTAVGFIAELPGKAATALGDLGTFLVDKGTALMQGFLDGVTEVSGRVVAFIKGLPQAIFDALGDLSGFLVGKGQELGSGIASGFRAAVNTIISGWNAIQFTLPSFDIGPVSFGGQTIGTPDIPLLDKGGIVTRPLLAALAANSRPEAVVPLDKLSSLIAARPNVTIDASVTVQGSVNGVDLEAMMEAQLSAIVDAVDSRRFATGRI